MEDKQETNSKHIYVQLKLCFNNQSIAKDFEDGSLINFIKIKK